MKILEIYGDDYAVLSFYSAEEQGLINREKMWQASDSVCDSMVFESDDYFEYRAYTFNDIDPNFIDFVLNTLCDHDDLNHHSFVVVP